MNHDNSNMVNLHSWCDILYWNTVKIANWCVLGYPVLEGEVYSWQQLLLLCHAQTTHPKLLNSEYLPEC